MKHDSICTEPDPSLAAGQVKTEVEAQVDQADMQAKNVLLGKKKKKIYLSMLITL